MKSFLVAFAPAGFSVALILSQSVAAQTPPPTPSQSTPSESSPSDASLTGGTVINAKLDSPLDSKKAKPGAQVIAETTEPVKSSDGRTVLPKGAKLAGHVTEASSKQEGANESTLAIQFDKAKLKSGQELQLTNVRIQAIAAPEHEASTYGSVSDRSAMPDATPGAPANNPSMAGSRGARPEGTSPAPNTPQYPAPSAQANGTPTAQGQANNAGPLPVSSRGVYGIEGVRISSAQSGEGTVLTSSNKNVHLDSGTRLLLVVQPQAAATSPGR